MEDSRNNPACDDSRWAQTVNLLGHALWHWQVDTNCWTMSPACADVLGWPDLRGDAWLQHIHEDDRPHVTVCQQQHVEHGSASWQCHLRVRDAHGDVRWLLLRAATVARDDAGRAREISGSMTDISAVEHTSVAAAARERRLAAAMEQAQIAWFERDLDTDVGIGPPSLAAIYGLSSSIGPWHYDEIRAHILPEDLPQHVNAVQDSLRLQQSDRETRSLQYRIRRPDGSLRDLEVRYRNEFEGGHGRAFGLIFDVTATKALETNFQDAMETMRMAWFERDLATDEMRGSRSLWSIYGIDPLRQPLTFSDLLERTEDGTSDNHPALGATLRARSLALAGVPQHEATQVVNYRIRPPGQSIRWIEVRYRVYLDGLGGGLVSGLVFDVTESKLVELALRDSKARLRLALDAAAMASWEWHVESQDLHSRDALGELLGLPGSGPWSRSAVEAIVHPDDLETLARTFQHRHHWQPEHEVLFRVCGANGETRWLEVRGRTGEQGLYGIALDVTARKQGELERQRQRLRQQLQQSQKMEAIGLLTGGIAHDFNNILASIIGYTDLAVTRFGNVCPPKLTEYLKEVQVAGARARNLVGQLLAFSRGESAELVPTELAAVVEPTTRMLRPILPATLDMVIDIAQGMPPVPADTVQLQQVLLNLCINARDAMAGRGRLVISLGERRVHAAHCASCHADIEGRFAAIAVRDDGPGMSTAVQARIFEPFFSTKTDSGGTGMGLAMVHGIVHRHQGHILLDSAPGAGSAFTLLLPLAGDTLEPERAAVLRAEELPSLPLPQSAVG